MEIKLNHDDLTQAIGNHLIMMGINIQGKEIDFRFHRGRGNDQTTSASIILTGIIPPVSVIAPPPIALLTTPEAIDFGGTIIEDEVSNIEAAAELLEQPLVDDDEADLEEINAEVLSEISDDTEEVLDGLQDEDEIDDIFKGHD